MNTNLIETLLTIAYIEQLAPAGQRPPSSVPVDVSIVCMNFDEFQGRVDGLARMYPDYEPVKFTVWPSVEGYAHGVELEDGLADQTVHSVHLLGWEIASCDTE